MTLSKSWMDKLQKSGKFHVYTSSFTPKNGIRFNPYVIASLKKAAKSTVIKSNNDFMDGKWALIPRYTGTLEKLESERWPKFMLKYVESIFDFLGTFASPDKIEQGKVRQAKENSRQLLNLFDDMKTERLEDSELARAKVLKHFIIKLLQSIKKPSTARITWDSDRSLWST